jgi:hypothetical protein
VHTGDTTVRRTNVIEGIFIGGLIGLVTGVIALVALKTIIHATIRDAVQISAFFGQIFAIPPFWFGGPWLTTEVLGYVDKEVFVLPYIISLAVTFFTMMTYPLYKWIKRLGELFSQ